MTEEALLDGFDHVETRAEFSARLREKAPLAVKLGLDPTSPDLHLGHAVVLRKLQQFVEGGHRVVLVIGSFTARIGDPSGKNETRPPLTADQIEANMRTYTEQAGKVLDVSRVQLRYNSEWLEPLTLSDLLRLLSEVTVAQMLARNDFDNRYKHGTPISLHEFLYPVAQAYDSLALRADVELGGNDQLFNLLLGREYQGRAGQRPQICMTVPLLEGLDGQKKMSKSLDNSVGLTEPAPSQFGKLMSIPDSAVARYARYAAFRSAEECAQLALRLAGGAHPMEEKKSVAQEIVARYHGTDAAEEARAYFERTVQQRAIPTADLPELSVGGRQRVVEVIVAAGFAESKRAAERLIAQRGVKVDGILVTDPKAAWSWAQPATLSVGSRKFVRVLPNER